jgi:hypothetical protein
VAGSVIAPWLKRVAVNFPSPDASADCAVSSVPFVKTGTDTLGEVIETGVQFEHWVAAPTGAGRDNTVEQIAKNDSRLRV